MRAESSLIDGGYDCCLFIENPGGGGSEIAFDLHSWNPPPCPDL